MFSTMPGYLLLRDNKETGPHTLEEMIAKDLKQHDLIWVEGRSAAWRYPEELDEFRKYISIAPVVAENAKPPAINEMYQPPVAKKPVIPETQQPFSSPSATPKSEPVPARDREAKYISVIFPNTVKPAPEKKQPDTPSVAAEKIPPVKKEKTIVEDEIAPTFSSSSFSNKFPERKLQVSPKQDKGFNIAKNLIWGVAILMGGIVLGLSLDNIFKPKSNTPPIVEPTTQQSVLPASQEESNVNAAGSVENDAAFATKATAGLEKPVEKTPKKRPVEKIADASIAESDAQKKTNSANDNNAVTTAMPVKNDAINEEKERTKANIRGLISVTNNKFKIGAFGGINELQISVTNNSHYPVDVVAVDVQYVLANKKVFKTETLYFRELHPGVTLMQQAPKSPRGVKVEYSINTVNSKALGL